MTPLTLAFYLMALRLPYTGDGPPGRDLSAIRDYEILAVQALTGDRLSNVIEEALSSPLHFRALQEALRHLREREEPIPDELREWAFDVADGARQHPTSGPGRPPTNQVRDALIVETIQKLSDCGMNPTRNEVSPPNSGCDAVSEALSRHQIELSFEGVAQVWRRRNR